jgi:adenylate cyclase
MRPFKAGDSLRDHTVPIGEVMTQLQTQLAEFKALKEQLVMGNAAIPDPAAQIAVNFGMTPRSSRSGLNSNSSSRAGLANGASTP